MGPINSNEEISGPVLSILRWRDEGEAVAMANATEYGLSAALWTNDLKAAIKMGRKIDCGYVWINTAGSHFLGTPFGGRDRKSTRLNSSHHRLSRMPSSA